MVKQQSLRKQFKITLMHYRPLFIYVNEKALKDNKVMSEFIKFVLEDKGKAAEEAGYVAAPEKTYKSQLDDLKAFIDKNQNQTTRNLMIKSLKTKIIRRNFKCVLKHDFDGESLFRVQSLIYRDADFDIQLVYKLINLK